MSTIIKWFSAVLGLIAIFILVAFVRSPINPEVWEPPKIQGSQAVLHLIPTWRLCFF